MRIAFTVSMMFGMLGAPVFAAQFSSVNDCTIGKRVKLNNGQHGKITRIDRPWSYCYVLLDDTGKEMSLLYSLLSEEGGGSADKVDKLIIGKYDCWVGRQIAMSMEVLSPSTYEAEGKRGKYRVEASGKIVFETGPFSSYNSKLLDSHRIGLNLTGGTFYNMACDPPR